MPLTPPSRRYRFGTFEADAATGELRQRGLRIKLHAQPSQLLFLLLARPNEILTREDICAHLWPDGTFVDYEHGVNSAINRLRDALNDKAANPRFIETLARRGYRFIAPVERIEPAESAATTTATEAEPAPTFLNQVLATPADLPQSSHPVVQTLFLLLQVMYVAFYVGALANLAEIQDLLAPISHAAQTFTVILVTASLLIPVRIFLFCAALFHAPHLRQNYLRLWWAILPFDILWSLSPFLLLHHINYGLALACMTPLVYSPFAQRSLILMGAGRPGRQASPAV